MGAKPSHTFPNYRIVSGKQTTHRIQTVSDISQEYVRGDDPQTNRKGHRSYVTVRV